MWGKFVGECERSHDAFRWAKLEVMWVTLFLCFSLSTNGYLIEEFERSDLRAECWPPQCAVAQTNSTWDSVVKCRAATPQDCAYTGKFVYTSEAVSPLLSPLGDGTMIFLEEIPVRTSQELNGTVILTDLYMSVEIFSVAEASLPVYQCLYYLSKVISFFPTIVPPGLKPEYACEADGYPTQYRISDTLEVLGMVQRSAFEDLVMSISLGGIPFVKPEFYFLVEPTPGRQIGSIIFDGVADFTMRGSLPQKAWEEASAYEATASLSPLTGSAATCVLTLGSEAVEAASVGECVHGLGPDLYNGSFVVESLVGPPGIQCSRADKLWTEIRALDLIGDFQRFRATRVSVRMKTRAFQLCEVRLLETDPGETAADKCAALDAGGDAVSSSKPVVAELASNTTDLVLTDVRLGVPLLGLAFSHALSHCGTAVHQIWVEDTQVDFTLNVPTSNGAPANV
eukprot:Gregarina_sp_Pseudo_9__5319@NODE_624_length_2474_cov_154_635318_g509_i1_p1_GENE_NODE_624_length_2474_cov_154_635318_g509_i1NODE_624_length_2474_cov_154_635318_g509_i1_p1_ORF_typecomplete_len454_score95_70_NODE_624_length_2474_cov_154_635318_g509_i12411602